MLFYATSKFTLAMNQSVSKVFTWFVLDDSIAINISAKKGFERCELFGEILHFVTYECWKMLGHINILKGSRYEDNTLLIPTLITRPPYLQYSAQCLLSRVPPPHFPSLSGRSPMSETLDNAGSALSTKFRKPLATSNHYFRKRERAMRG